MNFKCTTIMMPMLFLSVLATAATEKTISLKELKKSYERPKNVPYLEDNPFTTEKELLGKNLYFDPRLSGSGMISCATCHNPSLGWSDGLEKAMGHGHKQLGRNTSDAFCFG